MRIKIQYLSIQTYQSIQTCYWETCCSENEMSSTCISNCDFYTFDTRTSCGEVDSSATARGAHCMHIALHHTQNVRCGRGIQIDLLDSCGEKSGVSTGR